MAKARRKTKKTTPKKNIIENEEPKIVTTREELEAELKKIPPEELNIPVMDEPPSGFKPNPNLNPMDPNDMDAINEEARQFREKVQLPAQAAEEAEAREEFDRIIETEADFLEHFQETDKYSFQVVHEGALLTFNVKPLEPGDDFSKLNVDTDVFADMDKATRNAIVKKGKGEELTDAEEALIGEIDKDKSAEMAEATLEMTNSVLSQFITPPEFNSIADPAEREAKRLEFWQAQPLTFKIFLTNEVTQRLGLDMETRFKIFQPSRNR